MASAIPNQLGRHEILDEIGRGAMGVVYLAKDPLIGRLVALKTFRVGLSARDKELAQFRDRFLREAQSAGILSHPNIVTIHDVEEKAEEGTAFIAMEYVRGTDLKQLLQRGESFDLSFTADIIWQVAEALEYAHSKGVVHRDVKPANILITSDNRVKITDFGIARLNTSNLTLEGQLLGTPNYMAPEQVQGKDVDHRSDIFSVGVVLYEMLTGQKPFQGENLTVVSHKIVNEPFAPPDEYIRNLPTGLRRILERAMAKDPGQRYQRIGELAQELRQVADGFASEASLSETQEIPILQLDAEEGEDEASAEAAPPTSESGEGLGARALDAVKTGVQKAVAALGGLSAARSKPAAATPEAPVADAGPAVEADAAPEPAAAKPEPTPGPATEPAPEPAPEPAAALPTSPTSSEPAAKAAEPVPVVDAGSLDDDLGTGVVFIPPPPLPATTEAEAPTADDTVAAEAPRAEAIPPAPGGPDPVPVEAGHPWRRTALLAAAAAVLTLLLGVFAIVTVRSGGNVATSDPMVEELRQVLPLVQLGHRNLAADDPEAAVVAFRQAERMAPQRPGIRALRQRAEMMVAELEDSELRAEALEELVVEGQAAFDARQFDTAADFVRQALEIDPENEAAVALLADVETALERRQAVVAARRAAARRAAEEEPEPVAEEQVAEVVAEPVVEEPEPVPVGDPTLVVSFSSQISEGVLTIYRGTEQLLREPFRYTERVNFFRSRKTSGGFERRLKIPPGPSSLRVYLAGDQTQLVEMDASFPAGVERRLVIRVDGSGRMTATLR